MVPYRQSAADVLLPFEKRLIQELGITEDEYRAFAAEVRRRPYIRPAEYAHIPDAVNGDFGISLLVSVIVGALFTAASYLLSPKPQQPEESKARTRQLGKTRGREIFTPTTGFDSIQNLAAYGDIVPIVFTRRQTVTDTNETTFYSGGILISPAMVWSRMKSFGNYQIAEVVAIAGQGYMERCDLAGVFLGNNSLDALYSNYFDFYWNAGVQGAPGNSRLQMRHLRYGALRIDDGRGKTEEAFYAPTRNGANDAAFSGAMTPSSQTRFGVYAGIPNGTPIRPDWEIYSIIEEYFDGDRMLPAGRNAYINQKKFVDPYLMIVDQYGGGLSYDKVGKTGRLKAGMPGTGRNYCRRIGIVECNGITQTATELEYTNSKGSAKYWENLTREVTVNIGDTMVILLGIGRQDANFLEGESEGITYPRHDDIRSTVDSELKRYDAQLKLGATFMVGRTMWQVIDRPEESYDPRRSDHRASGFRITLRCIDAWSSAERKVGIVSQKAIAKETYLPYSDIEEAFYPILQYELASIQNTRRCDVTEIGIKSQVWCKFNNITNFNTLKSPGKMAEANKDNIILRAGKMTTYAERVSFFALDVRPTNSEAVRTTTINDGWTNVGPYLFAVRGDAPVDIFSFIRVTHPNRSQLEFRLRPFNSAIFTQQSGGETEVFCLDGRTPYVDWTFDTYLGKFRVGGRGYFIKPRDHFTHPQMAVRPELLEDFVYGTWETQTSVSGVTRLGVVARDTTSYITAGDAATDTQISNVLSNVIGLNPWTANLPVGYTTTYNNFTYTDGTRTVVMRLYLRAFERNLPNNPKNKWWTIDRVEVVSSVGAWKDGEQISKSAAAVDGTRYYFQYAVQTGTDYVENNLTYGETRLFQKYSVIAEVSHYGDLISRSCDNGPEHEVVYVNECLSDDPIPAYSNCAVAGLKLRSSDNFNQLDQLRCYIQNGIHVERLVDGDVGPSNLLTDLFWYLVSNADTGVASIVDPSLVDKPGLTTTGRFLRANNLLFDDVIAEPINLRSWLAEMAPSVLCYTTIKNGKLSIEPALPYDKNYKIDATNPITISGMFTDGNIIDDSLTIDWLELEGRKMFQAAILYRWSGTNKIPEEQTLVVRYNTAGSDALPIEEFNLPHITTTNHALLTARYFLAVRKHVTHTITFKTLPWGLSLAPGQYIRVSSELSPYSPTNNGIIKADGTVIAASVMTDGTYAVYYWERTQEAVQSGQLVIANGIAQNMRDAVFSVYNASATSEVYQIEALDLDEEGIVTIKASNFPVDASRRSLIARDTLDADSSFIIEGPQSA